MKEVIAVVNQFALPREQGGGTRHTDLFRRVTKWSHVIIAGDRNHYTQTKYATDDRTFKLIRLPRAGKTAIRRFGPWVVFSVRAAIVLGRRTDLVAVYASTPQILAPLAGLIVSRLKNIPFVLEVRDMWPETLVSAGAIKEKGLTHRALSKLEQILVSSADAIVGVTEGWEQHFRELGFSTGRYWTVPNGTETADFYVSETRDELRTKHSISGFTAIYAGAHGQVNALDEVLDAASELPDLNFILIGDGSEKGRLESRAEAENISNVEFRPPISKSELPKLLRACDVGIHSIGDLEVLSKGMSPNKIFDYMAAGLPVVSNAAGPLGGVILDDECGPLGKNGDLPELLKRVKDSDSETRARWRNRAEEVMSTRFSRASAADRLTEALGSVLDVEVVSDMSARKR